MTKSVNSCVVYVLTKYFENNWPGDLAVAQQKALNNKLPLAVVYCLEQWNDHELDELRPVETDLADLGIPLIVLIGEAKATLNGFIHHTNPSHLAKYDSNYQDDGRLISHPISWPGVVIKINQLEELHAKGKLAC